MDTQSFINSRDTRQEQGPVLKADSQQEGGLLIGSAACVVPGLVGKHREGIVPAPVIIRGSPGGGG